MARNWLGELVENGHLINELRRETGLARSTVIRLIRGGVPKPRQWTAVYNTARRLAAADLRRVGRTRLQAKRQAPKYYQAGVSSTHRNKSPGLPSTGMWTLWIEGTWLDPNTHKVFANNGRSGLTRTKPNGVQIGIDISIINLLARPDGLSVGEVDAYDPAIAQANRAALSNIYNHVGGEASPWRLLHIRSWGLMRYANPA